LYGDILSDLTAGMVGGLGVAPGANIGQNTAVFEPTHGSAPKYKGQNKVNPTAMILSGTLLLKHLGEAKAADNLEHAVASAIVEGKPEGLALDLNQSRPIEGFETQVVGVTTGQDGSGYDKTADSDIVVITAGLPRKPGMSRMDLIETNAKIVRQVAENVAKYSPEAV